MPAEVAKRILADGGYTNPKASEGGTDLLKLAWKLRSAGGNPTAWNAAIDNADADDLIFVLGALQDGFASERDAARAMVERKLNAEMIAKMRDLERASVRLQWVAIGVAVFLTIAQVAVALWLRAP